jgi:hypothetical protein
MADDKHFERLVSNLPLSERQSLLEKLTSQSLISQDPLYVADKEEVFLDIEEQYVRLAWYERLWYIILSIFRGKPPVKLYEEHRVSVLGHLINEQSPGLYDFQNARLLPPFHSMLNLLKTAARFFYTALDAGFNTDKGAFYAFLGSLEMPEIHARLIKAVDPVQAGDKNPDATQSELRQAGLRGVEDALRDITEEHRATMYYNARTLFCLKELSVFPFDRILMSFANDSSKNAQTCSVNIIKEMLINLNNILFSFKTIPPMTLLESLFVFVLQEKAAGPGFDMHREIQALVIKAEAALRVIRDFNRQVPLNKIILCSSRNNPVQVREISGGEDWYSVYRDHWKRQAEENIAFYFHNRREKALFVSFKTFLNGAEFQHLDNAESETNPDGFPLNGVLSFSFLLSFYTGVFMPSLNNTLKIIMIDGEFSKKENRIEYNEAYNNLIKMDDMIHKLDFDIGPSGDYGKRYTQARQEICALPIKRKKVQIVLDEVYTEAGKILEDARRSLKSLAYIMEGVAGTGLYDDYSQLSNMAKLTDKNEGLLNSIKDTSEKLTKALDMLNEIDNLDIR